MLDVLLGAQTALNELMKLAKKERDPSIIRLCVSEAENISKTAVRLVQSMSAWEVEHPGEVNRNLPPPPADPELEELASRFLAALEPVGAWGRAQMLDDYVSLLSTGAWAEDDYARSRDFVRTPVGDTLSVRDWLEVLSRYRTLTPAETMDLNKLRQIK